jgi:hypothetical protein
MVKSLVKQLVVLIFPAFLFACSSANNKPLLINFSRDSSAIVFSNIGQAGLLQLQKVSDNDSMLNSLIAVLQSPSEKDPTSKELPVDGKVLVTDSNIVFIPVRPFVKGRDYLVITHLSARFGAARDLLKGEVTNRVRPQQKLLRR